MTTYVIRRILYAVPIVIGVNLITFVLFFFVNTPDDMARAHLGAKRVTEEQISRWKREHGYQFPYFYNDGWTEIEVRQVSGEEMSLRLPSRQAGEYRLRVEVPSLEKGTLDVKVTTDETARLLPAGAPGRNRMRFHLADRNQEAMLFRLEPIEGAYHDLDLSLQPSKAAPLAIVRLYFRENLSVLEGLTETIFWKKSVRLLFFQFGISDDGRNIGEEIRKRIRPSLAVTIPIFLIGLFLDVTLAGILAFYRGTYLDFWGVVTCVVMMSVSILFYVIGGQWLLGKALRLVPVSGYDTGLYAAKFVVLPVVIGIIGGVGNGVRWYRTIYLEEMGKDYVRTARAKGLPESIVLYKHTLKNAMIPILTGVVVTIPFLFIGSLVLESFFAIPGMGSFTLEAIQRQDFAIVQAMVFLGSVLYIVGLILTDISYTLVDPRIRLE